MQVSPLPNSDTMGLGKGRPSPPEVNAQAQRRKERPDWKPGRRTRHTNPPSQSCSPFAVLLIFGSSNSVKMQGEVKTLKVLGVVSGGVPVISVSVSVSCGLRCNSRLGYYTGSGQIRPKYPSLDFPKNLKADWREYL